MRWPDAHKPHRWSLHGFDDRFGVGSIVVLAPDIGLYELRRHQTDIVPKRGDFSSSIMGRVAGFNPNRRRRQSGKKRYHLRASEFSLENGLSRIVEAVNLKDVLGQIQPDYCYLDYPPPSLRSPLILRSFGNQGSGAVHSNMTAPDRIA